MTTRRNVLAVLGSVLAAPFTARAQELKKVPRIGVLLTTEMSEPYRESLRQSLRDHGYVEGKNILIEWRAADGRPDRAKTLAMELAQLKVAIIVANQTPAVQAAKDATSTIPIVMAPAADPVAAGLIGSLSRPGGNITGVTGSSVELAGKRIELLQEVIPGLSRVGLLFYGGGSVTKAYVEENQTAAKRLGVQLHAIDLRRAEDVNAAFATLAKAGVGAVVLQAVQAAPGWRAAEIAVQHRLATISFNKEFPQSGGLLSYGTHRDDVHRRAAAYVDKILKGARPADLPVEQPTRFELVINRKTAKALGITIPPALLLRADQVIE